MRVSQRTLIVIFVLLAFGLRIYRLNYQPLRGDESFSIQFSAHGLDWLFPNIANIEPNPPLYYLLLHYWMALLGQSEFVTRFLSLVFGVVSVPLIYQLGRSMRLPKVGILAAFLMAINPFQIWHAQDVRNYTVWPALSMASLALLLHAVHRGKPKHWLGYTAMALLSVYTHYYDMFLLLFQNLFVLSLAVCRRRQKGMSWAQLRGLVYAWLASQAVLAIAFIPWLIYGSSRLTEVTEGTSPALWTVFWRCLTAFAVGETVPEALRVAALPFLLALLVWCLTRTFRKDRYHAVFLILFIVVPSVCVFAVAQLRPLFRERYLNAIAPAYYLAISWALVSTQQMLRRWRNVLLAVGVALLALAGAYSLLNLYFNPAYQKSPDWRGLTSYLERETNSGDVIILNYPDPTFSYYYAGEAPGVILPRGLLSEQEKVETARSLNAIAEEYEEIWFYPLTDVRWDNEGFVEKWLNRHAILVDERDILGFRWLIYTPAIISPDDVRCPLEVQVGESIVLRGYDAEHCFASGQEPERLQRGSTFRATLYWEASDEVRESYSVFLHLVDSSGHIWAQRDGPPRGGDFPTEAWRAGDMIADPYSITVPLDAPPGEYALLVGMYQPETGQRLYLETAEGAKLGNSFTIAVFEMG